MNEIKIFSNPQFGEIRTVIGENGEPLFCLPDLCRVLDLTPSKVAQRLGDDVLSKYPITDALGREQMANFINEDGLYDSIFDSRKPEARKFRKWVTSEVLPSIRKSGGYMVAKSDDTAEDIMARALIIAQDTLRRKDERIAEQQRLLVAQGQTIADQNAAIAELHERTSYLDQILNSKSTVTTTQIAQDYGMSAKKFNIELRNLKIQRKVGGQWILYAPYNTMGYVHSETFIPECSTTGKVIMTTKWTQKGRLFLYETPKRKVSCR